ncbi:MAG: cobalamin-binding protein [Chloroflexaceae bacterium]|jgi:iron complex transport system substrate-binding protein|nr:cobalamin-binding protein [Chloroflexaceae bacterium]
MRIVSLLPSTTEIAYALGLGDALVAVTHECDYPPDARRKPVVTSSALDHSHANSAEIDAVVSAQLRDQISIYHLDHALLAQLKPTLILTQELCDVCAVSFATVQRAVRDLGGDPRILSLEPTSMAGIFETIVAVGGVTGREAEAAALVASLNARVAAVQQHTSAASGRPRVACLEWIDPPFGPGHWLPEMIEFAGGTAGLGRPHQPSTRITWDDVLAFAPEVIVLTPCGFDLERTVLEAETILPTRPGWADLPAVRSRRVYAVDGNAYFSRPGPRMVDSLELLASLVQPELCPGWGPQDGMRHLFS